MQGKIEAFKSHVAQAAANPSFVHHFWFVEWHLEIVEKIAYELLEHYPQIDKDLITVMVWMHDYGKTINFNDQYHTTQTEGRKKLTELGFEQDFIEKVLGFVEIMDKKMEIDMYEAPLEVQLVSSADGCSHLTGPFMYFWWRENPQKHYEQLMGDTMAKAEKDWTRKITLPEARKAFETRYRLIMEQGGQLPDKFLG
jgi:hypothetical protein